MEYLEYFLIGTTFVFMLWLVLMGIEYFLELCCSYKKNEILEVIGFVLIFITVTTGSGFFIINYLRNTLTN